MKKILSVKSRFAAALFAAIVLILFFTSLCTETPAAENDFESKRMERWHKSEIKEFNDDTFKPSKDNSQITSKFVHYEVGKSHEGVKYYLEYLDADNFYITFDNSKNTYGRQIELFIYDKTLPNKQCEEWSLYRANYYIAPFEKVTKQYKVNGGIKEKSCLNSEYRYLTRVLNIISVLPTY